MMTMTVSRLEELQEWFPQHTRGCIQDVLEQVGAERAPEVLLDLISDGGQGAMHSADIHPSQLFAALLPTEEALPPAARAASLMNGGTSTSRPRRLASASPKTRPPVPPSPLPLAVARSSAAATNGLRPGTCARERTWWPPWQGGKPMPQQPPPPTVAPPEPADELLDDPPQQLEELLQTLNSGSDDNSDSGADADALTQSKQPSPSVRPYDPASTGSALALSHSAAGSDGGASDDEGETTTEQLLRAMLGTDSADGSGSMKGAMDKGNGKILITGTKQTQKQTEEQAVESDIKPPGAQGFDWGSWEGSAEGGSVPAPQVVQQGPESVALPQQQSGGDTLVDVRHGPVLGAISIKDLVAGCSGVPPVAGSGVGSSGRGGSGGGSLSSDPGALQGGQLSSLDKRPLSAAASLYSLNGSEHKKPRSRSASRSGARNPTPDAKSETSSQSSGGVWDNTETALEFLESGFPEHGAPLLADLLAAAGGDANVVTGRLLDMQDEAEAHRAASQLQELRQAPAEQAEMDEAQKLALLAAEFSELSRGECRNALEAQAGNLQAAAAILALHASSAAAEKEAADFQVAQRLQQQEAGAEAAAKVAADAEIARRLHEMQLAEAEASPPTLRPSPAASPEDLAAIAAFEAGQDVVLQPPRQPTLPPKSVHRTAANSFSAVALHRPPPPPSHQRFDRRQQELASDALYDEMRGPAQRLWTSHHAAMQAASTAFRKGKTSEGHQLLAEAAGLKAQAKAKEDEASLAIFRAKNLHRHVEEIDLHGQHVQEALHMLRDLMAPYIKYRHHPVVLIITGRGSHSEDGEAKLRPVVLQYLQEQGLHFAEKPGSFEVHFH